MHDATIVTDTNRPLSQPVRTGEETAQSPRELLRELVACPQNNMAELSASKTGKVPSMSEAWETVVSSRPLN
jgi:hypothetical protein